MSRILVGPRDRTYQIEPSDERFGVPRRHPVTVHPAYRIAYEGDEWYELKMSVVEAIEAAWRCVLRVPRQLRWRVLEIAVVRRTRYLMRRAWYCWWQQVQDDGPIAQLVVLAIMSLVCYWILQ